MPIPDRQRILLEGQPVDVLVTDDGSRTLVHRGLDEAYHSGCGAAAESAFVFVHNSQLRGRLEDSRNVPTRRVRILEIGFGTGMNFLFACSVAESVGVGFDYTGLDVYWPSVDVLQQIELSSALTIAINSQWLPNANTSSVEWLLKQRALCVEPFSKFSGEYALSTERGGESVWLDLLLEDAVEWVAKREADQCDSNNFESAEGFDIVFFDAFSPDRQPEMWTTKMLTGIRRLCRPSGVVVSYCVKRSVKDSLAQAGFQVEIRPGPPGGKREVLVAISPS